MRSRCGGLTLIELLIAMAIGTLLVAVAVPVYTDFVERARVNQAVADIGGLEMRIEQFSAQNLRLPNDLGELPGAIPQDPWGQDYRYLRIEGAAPGIKGKVRKDGKLNPINSDYDLFSIGEDGETVGPLVAPKSQDDIVRAGNGGYIGLAADF